VVLNDNAGNPIRTWYKKDNVDSNVKVNDGEDDLMEDDIDFHPEDDIDIPSDDDDDDYIKKRDASKDGEVAGKISGIANKYKNRKVGKVAGKVGQVAGKVSQGASKNKRRIYVLKGKKNASKVSGGGKNKRSGGKIDVVAGKNKRKVQAGAKKVGNIAGKVKNAAAHKV